MRKVLTFVLLTLATSVYAYQPLWQAVASVPSSDKQVIHPDKYLVFNLNTPGIKAMLFSLSENPKDAATISIPSPDGKMKAFKVWQDPMMEKELADKFPGIKTFTAVSVDDPRVTAKLDYTTIGFHAMIFDGDDTYFIDPYSNPSDDFYLCYYKHDIHRSADKDACGFKSSTQDIQPHSEIEMGPKKKSAYKMHGANRYTYRLALACTGEYSIKVAGTSTPTVATSLSAMTTSINRVNGVYEREIGVHLNFVANNDLLIYFDGTTDPYNNGSSTTMKGQNQTNVNNVIGSANYDIGHVFCTTNAGIAELGAVCNGSIKAMGVTGQSNPVGDAFDIDYVVHEMGHQFGANHTFNVDEWNSGSCRDNGNEATAYEPGGGTTIMAYAGICDNNNIQQHSDDYFHAASLKEISNFLVANGSACATTTLSGNVPPIIPPITSTYEIPHLTPFELTAPAVTDIDHDWLNYCWEEWDLGDFGKSYFNVINAGPLFRSFKPSWSDTRIFPTLDSLRRDQKRYLGEKLPEVTRVMKFKLTVRDILAGYGTFNMTDDEVQLNVTSSSGPFRVWFPDWVSDYLQSGTYQTITWDVANTTAAPVSCSNVDIFLSIDDAATYPYTLAANTPNDGSETVFIPTGIYAGACRVKVKGAGNVFFDMSNQAFKIFPWPSSVATQNENANMRVYPIPAKTALHVDMRVPGNYDITAFNALGQMVYQSAMQQQIVINTQSWAAGVYQLKVKDAVSGEVILKKALIE
jgi:hypothetical protein